MADVASEPSNHPADAWKNRRTSTGVLDRLMESHRESHRHERQDHLGLHTPLGQMLTLSAPVVIAPHRTAKKEQPRVKPRRRGVPKNPLAGKVNPARDPKNKPLRDDERIGADETEASSELTLPDMPTTLLDAIALRRFPRESLRSSEGRVRAFRSERGDASLHGTIGGNGEG